MSEIEIGTDVKVELVPGVWIRARLVQRAGGVTTVESASGAIWDYFNEEVRLISPLQLLAEQAE